MSLSLKDRLTMAMLPSSYYYGQRIADEAAWGEHELYVLNQIISPGGTAVDVGANQGFFSFAFSEIADHVEAFEPNLEYADFARRMLGRRARVHNVALSNACGRGEFFVPLSERGVQLHLAGTLWQGTDRGKKGIRFNVDVRTLDSYAFTGVRVIKVDVEGSELDVLEGGRETIRRDRPPLIVELLTGTHENPAALSDMICAKYGYSPWIVAKDGKRLEAAPVIRRLGCNTTWGSPILNHNVLFLPQA